MSKIKVDNYGQMLATINDLEPVSYHEFGSYQGEYVAINADDKRFFIYMDSFGSCSGCDWLEAERDWEEDTVDYKTAVDYCGGVPPKLIVPRKHYSKEEWLGFISSLEMYDYSEEPAQRVADDVDAFLTKEVAS